MTTLLSAHSQTEENYFDAEANIAETFFQLSSFENPNKKVKIVDVNQGQSLKIFMLLNVL